MPAHHAVKIGICLSERQRALKYAATIAWLLVIGIDSVPDPECLLPVPLPASPLFSASCSAACSLWESVARLRLLSTFAAVEAVPSAAAGLNRVCLAALRALARRLAAARADPAGPGGRPPAQMTWPGSRPLVWQNRPNVLSLLIPISLRPVGAGCALRLQAAAQAWSHGRAGVGHAARAGRHPVHNPRFWGIRRGFLTCPSSIPATGSNLPPRLHKSRGGLAFMVQF